MHIQPVSPPSGWELYITKAIKCDESEVDPFHPYLFSNSFHLSFCVRDVHQVSEGQVLHTVAGCAHLLVHLVTTANTAGERRLTVNKVLQ